MPKRTLLVCPLALALLGVVSSAAEPKAAPSDDVKSSVAKAVEYLRGAQTDDGAYSPRMGPAVTAICTTGLLRNGYSPDDPLVAKSLKWLGQFVRPDGGIYMDKSNYRNYETALTLMCFAAANQDGRYDKIIAKAKDRLVANQLDKSEGKELSDFEYGGIGYGEGGRPDLSNTGILAEALVAAGEGAESEAMKKLAVFVSRCQNLETEHNTTPWASKINDGSFYYTPVVGGGPGADKPVDGGLPGYGSMTYVGLKSMIYAGVDQDDPRVKAAVGWVKKNYDLQNNPGKGSAGLYYYYHTMAKALDAMKLKNVADAAGKEHDWRAELAAELASRQQSNGSWVNPDKRWLEGDPNLVTGFVLLTLGYCQPDAGK